MHKEIIQRAETGLEKRKEGYRSKRVTKPKTNQKLRGKKGIKTKKERSVRE